MQAGVGGGACLPARAIPSATMNPSPRESSSPAAHGCATLRPDGAPVPGALALREVSFHRFEVTASRSACECRLDWVDFLLCPRLVENFGIW
jgi:hypothetical protein